MLLVIGPLPGRGAVVLLPPGVLDAPGPATDTEW